MTTNTPGYTKVIEYINDIFKSRLESGEVNKPIIIGISGPQGSGKSYGSERALKALNEIDSRFLTYPLLMDDVYLTHQEQQELTKKAKDQLNNNRLLQGRGLPGTHDLDLLMDIFHKVEEKAPVSMPLYDKALFNGEGDRVDDSQWPSLNIRTSDTAGPEKYISVLLLEGWFTGYKPLEPEVLKSRYEQASSTSILKNYRLEELVEINNRLSNYSKIWESFDYFINLETNSINNVYEWRTQQEHALIQKKGTGMSDQQVKDFISRYMVMYELYYKDLCRQGCAKQGCNLNIEIDLERNLVDSSKF